MAAKIILSTPPEKYTQAGRYGQTLAHMAYRIGEDFMLYRASIPLSLKGGLMVLDADNFGTGESPAELTNQIIRECIHRGFQGVVLAFNKSHPSLHALASALSGRLERQGGELYLPEDYAADSTWAGVMVSAAISGGSLTTRLREVCDKYGRERVCLDIERIRVDFCLPARDPGGKPLTPQELEALIKTHSPQPYFSKELCAYYFTFTDKDGSHFVLYDDAGSIRKKLHLAGSMSIPSAMLLYPEVEDILNSLSF